jgi:hypothetical protein
MFICFYKITCIHVQYTYNVFFCFILNLFIFNRSEVLPRPIPLLHVHVYTGCIDNVAWIYYVYINIVATSIHVHLLLMQQRATVYITVQ